MPEISQTDFDLLVQSRKILDAIYTDPEHGMAVKQAFKKAKPDAVIPELEAQRAIQPAMQRIDQIGEAVAKMNERMDAERQERQQQAEAERLASQMSAARNRFKLTDEGVEGMTAMMREKGIMDPVDAAELYVSRQPKPALASQRQGRYGQATYADVTGFADQAEKEKILLASPDRFLAMEIEQCLAEFGMAEAE